MDIEKDSNREAFEELIDIEIIISKGFKFNPNINQYYHPDHTNHRLSYAYLMGAWMVWQEKAQAVPDGFVLVPKEPTEEMLIKGNRLALADKGYRYDATSIWETMLEAVRGGK